MRSTSSSDTGTVKSVTFRRSFGSVYLFLHNYQYSARYVDYAYGYASTYSGNSGLTTTGCTFNSTPAFRDMYLAVGTA